MLGTPKSVLTIGIFALSLATVSCTVGNPDISAVNELPPIELDSGSQVIQSRYFNTYMLYLSGRVVKIAPNLQISFDSGKSWSGLSQFASVSISSTGCTDKCAFSYSLPNSGTVWAPVAALVPNTELKALIRGSGDFGVTAPTEFTIRRLYGTYQVIGALKWQDRGTSAAMIASGTRKVIGGRLVAVAGGSVGVGTITTAKGVSQ